ncbi:hypothetical protein PF008_g13590 [Phytophthora fragariae]|uniref:Serine aminopeptidase S33 domain-containing protein n=1 Tax=Phytophthora fragariae TaxID=53985 RepID=A0A6G0RJL4_9STRA|nr:hypothetical protein PF008_g13590 [Phytophthora fragariae]
MSAIHEERERSSLDNAPIEAPVAMSPPSSCSTSPTTSISSCDSSPDQQRATRSLSTTPAPSARASRSREARTRSVAKFEKVGEDPFTAQALKRVGRAQSARARPNPCFIDTPMTGVSALKAARAKEMKARSTRMRPVPCVDEAATTTAAQEKPTKAAPVRSRPISCFDDSLLAEAAAKDAIKSKPTKAKVAQSLRSRPVPCFEDLLASGPAPQAAHEGWKPRVIGTRPAASPNPLIPRSKSTASLDQLSLSPSSSSDDQSIDVQRSMRRRDSIPPLRLARRTARPKSSASKQRSRRRFPSEDETSMNRERTLSDGSQGPEEAPALSDDDLLPTSSSDSGYAPSSRRKTKKSSRPRHFEGKFENRRGQSLLYFSLFPPEKKALRGIILYLHGMGDHCRRNTALYERYCQEGFGVITYDLLNHGASDYDEYNTRAHISNFDDFVDDTNDFVTFAKTNIYKVALRYWRKHLKPHHPHGREKKRDTPPELPLIITGTSFGALIGLHTVLSGEHKFHAAVWASPSIGVTWTPVLWAQWKVSRALVAAFPTAKVIPAIQHNLRSRDPEFLKRFQEDPLTSSNMMTPRSGHQSLHAMMRLQEDTRVSDPDSRFSSVPMLFLAGSDDRISDQQASMRFYARMGSLDKEFKLFDGLYHMIYEEPEKEDVLKYLANWLHKRFPLETRHPNESHINAVKKLEPSVQAHNFVKAERTEL